MPKAILHIGTMKTGTTSIQATLAGNETALAKHGYRYLGPPMRHSSVLGPALKALSDKNSNPIISDEGLWHFAGTKRSDTTALAKLLESYDVTVVIYLRRPDSFLNSWFQQGLKTGTGTQTMTQFLAAPFVRSGMQFQDMIARFKSLFGADSITLRAYEKSQLSGGDAVQDFLQVVGLPIDDFTQPERANTTPDTDSLLLRSLFQHGKPTTARLATQLDKLDHHLSRYGYQGRRYSLLSQAELTEIITTYRPIFAQIQAQYGGGAAPDFFHSWPNPADVNPALLGLRRTQEGMLKTND